MTSRKISGEGNFFCKSWGLHTSLTLFFAVFAKISWKQWFTKEITKELIWWNFFRENFAFFHTELCHPRPTEKIFRQINYLVTSLVKMLFSFTNFLPIKCESEYLLFPQCAAGFWKLRKFTRTTYLQKFRESNGFTKELLNSWFDEIFFSVRVNVSLILHCVQETGMVQSRRSLVNPII